MGTTIKNLTDGIATKDAVAIDQLTAGVLSVTAGTGISVTGTPTNPVVNNTGVLSVTAGTGISITGTATNPIVNNTGVLTVTAGVNSGISTQGTATNPTIFQNSPLQTWAFAVTSTNAIDATGLYAGAFSMSPANADGAFEAGVVYQRGFQYISLNPSAQAKIRVIAYQAGAFTTTTGVRSYTFEIIKVDGTTGVLTATGIIATLVTDFAWAFPAPQTSSASGALVINPGDGIYCRLLGTQVSGAVGIGTINAFAVIEATAI